MRQTWLVIPILFVYSCGTEVTPLGRETQAQKPPAKCSVSKYETFHELMFQLSANPPPKLSIEVDGVEELNECNPEVPLKDDVPPFVTAERFSENRLGLVVTHNGAYPQLPREVAVRLINRKDCRAAPTTILDINKIPLEFVTDFPQGPKCPSRTLARVPLIRP